MEEKEEQGRLAEGNFQITMQLSQQRSIVISGYLYHGEDMADRNARLDAAQDLMDRQFIRCDIVNKEAQREAIIEGIKQTRDQLEELKALAGGGNGEKRPKLTSQQMEILKRGDENLRGHQKNVAMLDSLIKAAREKLGTTVA